MREHGSLRQLQPDVAGDFMNDISRTVMARYGLLTIWVLTLAVILTACEDRRADKAYLRDDYGKTAKELEGTSQPR